MYSTSKMFEMRTRMNLKMQFKNIGRIYPAHVTENLFEF